MIVRGAFVGVQGEAGGVERGLPFPLSGGAP